MTSSPVKHYKIKTRTDGRVLRVLPVHWVDGGANSRAGTVRVIDLDTQETFLVWPKSLTKLEL